MYEYRKLSPKERRQLVEQRLKQNYPPHGPPHLGLDQTHYLLTAACYEHRPHLHTAERRQQLLDLLFEQCDARGIALHGWVVLPNHYHLLAFVPEYRALGEVFRRVHGRTAHQWNAEEGARGRQVWYRFSDRAMRSESHAYTTLNYLHFNPVKHNAAGSPYDWVWSSVHWYRENFGREWLQDLWRRYPVRDYGKGWDEI